MCAEKNSLFVTMQGHSERILEIYCFIINGGYMKMMVSYSCNECSEDRNGLDVFCTFQGTRRVLLAIMQGWERVAFLNKKIPTFNNLSSPT